MEHILAFHDSDEARPPMKQEHGWYEANKMRAVVCGKERNLEMSLNLGAFREAGNQQLTKVVLDVEVGMPIIYVIYGILLLRLVRPS